MPSDVVNPPFMPLQQNQNIWRGHLNKTGRPLHLFHFIQDLQKLQSGINGGTVEEDTKTGEYLKNIVKNNFSKDKNKNIKSQTETRDTNDAKTVKYSEFG